MGHTTFLVLFILLGIDLFATLIIWVIRCNQKTAFYQHVGQWSYFLLVIALIILGFIAGGICWNQNWI